MQNTQPSWLTITKLNRTTSNQERDRNPRDHATKQPTYAQLEPDETKD